LNVSTFKSAAGREGIDEFLDNVDFSDFSLLGPVSLSGICPTSSNNQNPQKVQYDKSLSHSYKCLTDQNPNCIDSTEGH
jgi:hypothetical protein